MKRLQVKVGKEYEIHIETGSLAQAGSLIRPLTSAARAAILTDSNVEPLYEPVVRASLEQAGFQVFTHVFPAGEPAKNLESIAQMLNTLAENGFTRKDIVVALGGGVTGDMAGFTAAVYQRGVDFVQIPTSLLAQIDSSVGGKTGVDLPQGKNLCGAFWQPRLVLIDPQVLSTLPDRFFIDGMGEAVKYGCIKSAPLFERLEQEQAKDFLEELIVECVDIKRRVVEADEKEQGERALLNFGHTLGHALEQCCHYQGYSHGEAVAVGMMLAAEAGERNGLTPQGTSRRLSDLLRKIGLPDRTERPLSQLLAAALHDKKRTAHGLNFILLEQIGKAVVHPLDLDEFPAFFGLEE